ncbi:MAG: tetratricopeptide repeat protein [Actinomycetota bacterium]
MPRGSGGDGARGGVAGTAERFCGGCWAALPPGAATCPDCGRSLAEIEASRQAKLAADHNWIPPRKQDAAGAAAAAPTFATPDSNAEPPPVVGPALPDPLAQELRRSRHHFLMAVLIGSAWGGAVMAGAWFTIKNMSPARPPAGAAAGVGNRPEPAVGDSEAEVTIAPKLGSPVVWNNRYQHIKVELYDGSGLPVAGEGEPIRLPKGTFRVDIGPRNAEWRITVGTITAEPGRTVRVAITPQQAARFSLELGDRYDGTGKTNSAIQAWKSAAAQDPTRIDAHLRLATALTLKDRFREARVHVKAALALEPKNPDALESQRLLDELDKIR